MEHILNCRTLGIAPQACALAIMKMRDPSSIYLSVNTERLAVGGAEGAYLAAVCLFLKAELARTCSLKI
jgi:hypothetical protein